MAEFAAKNLAIVAHRWPEVYAAFEAAPQLESVVLRDDTPARTLQIAGLHLTSTQDREAEARLQASQIPDDAIEATVYGLALGDLVRVLLQRRQLKRLRLVLLNPSVALLALAHFRQSDWLIDPRLTVVSGSGSATLTPPFAVSPAALRLTADHALATRDALMLALALSHTSDDWSARTAGLAKNVTENRELVAADGDVGDLFGTAIGAHLCVVGAGPTLDAQAGWMRKHRANIRLIAASTAVQSLLRHQIVPDLVLCIDGGSAHALQPRQHADFCSVPLVYAAEVQRNTLRQWPGPRFAAYLQRPRYKVLARELPRASLWTSGTVIHSAADLAVKMGAARVTFVGVDFAYPGGKSHAESAPHLNRAAANGRQHSVIDGYGNRVLSAPNFIGYLRDLERFITHHPDVCFENTGRAAAQIAGAAFVDEAVHA